MAQPVGNGPPEAFKPDELFVALQQQPRPYRVVDFPRVNPATGQPIGQLAITPLTQGELIEAKADATRAGKALTKDNLDPKEYVVGHQQIYEELCGCEILWRACRQVANVGVKVFPGAADIRSKLSSDEVAVLMQSYAIVQVEIGPLISTMSGVEMDAWLKRLAEGASALPLRLLSSEALRALVMRGASRLHPSPTGSGSSGQPADDSMTNEPEQTASV